MESVVFNEISGADKDAYLHCQRPRVHRRVWTSWEQKILVHKQIHGFISRGNTFKITARDCITSLHRYRVIFNPPPPLFSTEMKKELLCLEICHLRWPLFGALAFLSFWYWKKKGKLKNHLAGKNTHENRNFDPRWCKKSRRWGGKNADPDWDYCSPQVTSSA